MESDPYKCLLTSASREHLKRQSELNDRFVGNVFLPAINRPSKGPAAVSPLKHLKVIEQCIMAENKREEQLAKCQNDKEKRYWSRKFHAQRKHERKLIQALMLGTTVDAELEIADVSAKDDTSAAMLSRSPLHAGVNRMTTGITAKVPSEDRVFHKAKITGRVPKTKPHIRKKFTLPDCQGSPNKIKPYIPRPKLADASLAQTKSLTLDHEQPSSKTLGGSPPHRGSRSATPLRVSQSKPKAAEPPASFSPPLSKFPLKQNRLGPAKLNSEHSPKKKHVKSITKVSGLPPVKVRFDTDKLDDIKHMLAFEGPTSFLEAQQIAMAALDEIKPQDLLGSEKSLDGVKDTGVQSAREDSDEEHDRGATSMRTKTDRPHSSPEARSKSNDVIGRSISHSYSAADVKPVEFLKPLDVQHLLQSDAGNESFATRCKTDLESSSIIQNGTEQESVDAHKEAEQGADEEQWDIYDEEPEYATSTPLQTPGDSEIALHEQENTVSGDAALDSFRGAAGIEQDLQMEEVDAEGLDVSSQQSDDHMEPATTSHQEPMIITMSAEELDDQAEMEVAEVLFDLVDQLAGNCPENMDPIAPQSPDDDGRSTSNSLSASIHIQSAFRGHQARRAFRMTLYQEALKCGVLGAMPGSFQGKSGWYQDSKSLMAYYFTILPDTGEWKQKIVIRCSRLILTDYQMHEEILSKVFISP